jgi:DNA-binding transcriptional MerR regulator
MGPITIGILAEATGVKVPTIRYYEEIGLMGRVPRGGNGRRAYGASDIDRLRFIRHARDLGFEIEAIRELIALTADPDRPCAEVDQIARGHLAAIEAKITQLSALRAELSRMIEGCAHGTVRECRIVEVIGDHGACCHHV